MANVEVITCDYAGCKEPFAYRVNGFNLCIEHVGAPKYAVVLGRMAAVAMKFKKLDPKPDPEKE